MPQGRERANPVRRGDAAAGRVGACIRARILLVGAAFERRGFAALFPLPEYRRLVANRIEPGPPAVRRQETTRRMQIIVRDNNVDQALRALKKKLQREGVYREMKLRRHYEKPSEKRARERAAAVRRARKMERKRMERDGIK
jgi:small subunit ribosomal protein S21